MKRIFTLLLIFPTFFFLGCSKDFLKSYNRRILGQWHIRDVKRIGIGGDINELPFRSGTLYFNENGTLSYTDRQNRQYSGSWEIIKRYRDDNVTQSLQITAIDFNNQVVLSEYYDDLNFRSTDHFVANNVRNFHTYVTHFRR
jgi:hypothetical protein